MLCAFSFTSASRAEDTHRPECFSAAPDNAKVIKYEKRDGPYKVAFVNGFAGNDWRVTAIQGDANLDQIQDVVHLLDTFFAGTPFPKALFGYVEGVARDVLEDLKRDYYDEIDHLQDTQAWEYEWCFRVHLLLRGISPGPDEFTLRFSERRTETPNQVADLALKLQALGFPPPVVWQEMGYDPAQILKAVEEWGKRADPFPPVPPGPPTNGVPGMPAPARVSVTPGNARKGESATSISTPGSNGGRGRG